MSVFKRIVFGVERWHYRILGILWALFGVALFYNTTIGTIIWYEPTISWWAPPILAIPYIIVGLAFCLRVVWSRWCMLLLVILQAYTCFSEWAFTPWYADQAIGRLALAGLAFGVYSLWFVIWSLIRIY